MTDESPEIGQFIRDFIDAKMRREADTVESMISTSPETLAIGTGPDEWEEGEDAVRVHVESFGDGARATLEEAKGYSQSRRRLGRRARLRRGRR